MKNIALAALAMWLALAILPANAEDASRGAWFKSLRQPDNGGSCCDIADCHAADAEYRKDGWWARVQGVMRPIPPGKVLRDKASIDGDAYVCSSQYPSANPTIYCFVPPPMGF